MHIFKASYQAQIHRFLGEWCLDNNIQENVENNADMLNDKTWENVAEEL